MFQSLPSVRLSFLGGTIFTLCWAACPANNRCWRTPKYLGGSRFGFRLQRPASLMLNTEFYSHYKGTTTRKALVGIVPSGAVSFVSKLYPGSISDKTITRAAGILDLLQPGDEVMVDMSFTIADLLEQLGAKLVIRPFLTSARPQLERSEVSDTQSIARSRIHAERAIRRVKSSHL